MLGYHDESLEVMLNPDRSDAAAVLRANEFIRAFIFENGDWIIWNAYQAIHIHVLRDMPEWLKQYGDPIPVYIYGVPGRSGANVKVTDTAKQTKWYHSPEVASIIKGHKGLTRVFPDPFVSYYDEMMHGDWEEPRPKVWER
jgi:hypothetical protein